MIWSWLKHAFAVEKGDAEPDPAQREAIDRICREIVRRGLTLPALAFLEASRPLNYLGAQAMHFFQPFLGVFTDSESPARFAAFLEKRGSVEYLCRRLEQLQTDDPSPRPGDSRTK